MYVCLCEFESILPKSATYTAMHHINIQADENFRTKLHESKNTLDLTELNTECKPPLWRRFFSAAPSRIIFASAEEPSQ